MKVFHVDAVWGVIVYHSGRKRKRKALSCTEQGVRVWLSHVCPGAEGILTDLIYDGVRGLEPLQEIVKRLVNNAGIENRGRGLVVPLCA